MPEQNALTKNIQELLDAILKTLGYNTTKKHTWHQHVVPYENNWAVRREGNQHITSKHRKQSTAIRKSQNVSQTL